MTCEHAWSVPSYIEAAPNDYRIEGRCMRCGLVEVKPVIVWLNLFEAYVQRMEREQIVAVN